MLVENIIRKNKTVRKASGIADRFFLYAIIILSLVLISIITLQNLPFIKSTIGKTQKAEYKTEKINIAATSPELKSDAPSSQRNNTLNVTPELSIDNISSDIDKSASKTPEKQNAEELPDNNTPITTTHSQNLHYSALDSLAETQTPVPQKGEDLVNDLKPLKAYSTLKRILIPDAILKRTVKATHGISKGQLIRSERPIKLPKGSFIAEQAYNAKENYVVSLKNYRRYDLYINTLTRANTQSLATLYWRYAPYFDAEYQQLNTTESKTSFYPTLTSAIDLLINTPRIDESARLYRSNKGYKFVNQTLENMPSTSKLMVRMGEENRRKLSNWLISLREELERVKP